MIGKNLRTNSSIKRTDFVSPWNHMKISEDNALWFKGYLGFTRGAYFSHNYNSLNENINSLQDNFLVKETKKPSEPQDLPVIIELNEVI